MERHKRTYKVLLRKEKWKIVRNWCINQIVVFIQLMFLIFLKKRRSEATPEKTFSSTEFCYLQVWGVQIWMSGPQLLSHMLDASIWIDYQCNLILKNLITFHQMISFNQQSNFQLVNQNEKYLKLCLQRLTRRLVNNSGLVNLYRRRSSCLQYLKRIKFVCSFNFCYFDICWDNAEWFVDVR